jgi:hypothetical protein
MFATGFSAWSETVPEIVIGCGISISFYGKNIGPGSR